MSRMISFAASDKAKDACIDGWIAGMGALVPEKDRTFTRSLGAYYLGAHLRGDPAIQARLSEVSQPTRDRR